MFVRVLFMFAVGQSNHLGHFLLTILLLPVLTDNGRVVNVSSEVHDPANKAPLPDAGLFWPETAEEYDSRLAGGAPGTGLPYASNVQIVHSHSCTHTDSHSHMH